MVVCCSLPQKKRWLASGVVSIKSLVIHPVDAKHVRPRRDRSLKFGRSCPRCPLPNCWRFVNGTARPMCCPSTNQRIYFSGHKRLDALKYQSIMCANCIICQLECPYPGHRHDAGILCETGLYEKLEKLVRYLWRPCIPNTAASREVVCRCHPHSTASVLQRWHEHCATSC